MILIEEAHATEDLLLQSGIVVDEDLLPPSAPVDGPIDLRPFPGINRLHDDAIGVEYLDRSERQTGYLVRRSHDFPMLAGVDRPHNRSRASGEPAVSRPNNLLTKYINT